MSRVITKDEITKDEAVYIEEIAKKVKQQSVHVAALTLSQRNQALLAVTEALNQNRDTIFEANRADMDAGMHAYLPDPILKRLKFDKDKMKDAIAGIEDLVALPDPLAETLLRRELDEGLVLEQTTCPIGVIGVIFESRPDALIQIASLCLKSGNCAILKGGSEAAQTNRILYRLIHDAGLKNGLPEGFLTLVETRAGINALLDCDSYIDLIIPRGSNQFVRYIMDHTRIPVMGHSDGICVIYADKSLDFDKAIPVILDAKTQYVAACNAVETLLVHREAAETLLPPLFEKLRQHPVSVRGCGETRKIIAAEAAAEEDFKTEYLDYTISIKIVSDIDEAISHINQYGSHHTDCILTEDAEAAEYFMQYVDSAGVYQNCSTRFSDGFRYGFGAEVGISTGKLHARGPVGLRGLVTYKYKLYGRGQTVGEYAEGKKSFKYRDL